MNRRKLLAALPALCAAAPASAAARAPREGLLLGVNIAGLEFKPGAIPGRLDTDYTAPRPADISYFAGLGFRVIRLPFLWERLQPEFGGGFNADYFGLIERVARNARESGMRIVLEPHQYGRRRVGRTNFIIGETPNVSSHHFALFWREFSTRFREAPHVIFGLQNEPHDQNMDVLVSVQNGAIAAIRQAGCRNLVLASGNAWSGAHSWRSSGNASAMLRIHDPANALAFDVHQYLDRDSSGTNNACTPNAGSRRLEPFTQWARANRRRGFLGEFAAGRNDACSRELAALLDHLQANRDVWLGGAYWAGGPWWGEDYEFNVTPRDLARPIARPQTTILQRYL